VSKRTVPRICKKCGKEFLAQKSDVNRGFGLYCNKKCFNNNYIRLKYPKEYKIWISMKERCSNKSSVSYYRYGAIGISVCDRWRESFDNFITDMGQKKEGMTLDRIDNHGNYEPSNCRWADRYTQAMNKPRGRAKHSTSGYIGVFSYNNTGKWLVKIINKGTVYRIGVFQDKKEAALAYNEAAKKHHKEYAELNII